jgi:hypothetical protein
MSIPRSCTPVAERMRRYRKRRRRGMRCVRVEVNLAEVEALIRKGYLNDETRNDRYALTFAVGSFIYDALTAEA